MADVLVTRHDRVTVFTLNRPQKLNAMTRAMGQEFMQAFGDFEADQDQHVAVITGAGDQAFSAGADLTELAARNKAPRDKDSSAGRPAGATSVDLWGVGRSAKPTIAAINGLAVGGGLELSLNCDIRIAADTAWFGAFEVRRGMMAGIAVNLLARYMPIGDALYMLMTADRLSAADALRLGLAQRVVPAGSLTEEVMRVAELICKNSQVAVQASKRVAYFWRNLAIRESMDYYRAVQQRLLLCDDVVEGPRAFAEGRPPQFTHRWPERATRGVPGD
jgi:enoyl-CoA hydratase/carnithine racemase